MPGLPEEMYCSEQIHIPPTLPYIIRQFAKAAIRTQPKDLLRWSCAYFRSMADGMEPPTKVRLEYPIPKNYMGMTPGFLRVLLKQFGKVGNVQWSTLLKRWTGICLQEDDLIKLLLLGKFDDANQIPWLRFIAIAAGHLNDNLSQTMIMLCELLTEEPEGGSATIPVQWFIDLYLFLANIDASKQQILPNKVFSVGMDSDSGVALLPRQPQRPGSAGFNVDAAFESGPNKAFQMYGKTDDSTSHIDGLSTVSDAYSAVSAAPEVPADTVSQSPELTLTNEEGVESTIDTTDSSTSSSEQAAPTTPRSNTSQIVEQLSNEITELSRKNDELIVGRCHLYEKTIALVNLIGRSTSADLSEKSTPRTDDSMRRSKFVSDTTTLYRSGSVTYECSAIEMGPKKSSTIYQEFLIESVNGIGPIVSTKRQEKFVKYIKERAAEQHAMVMPRNLRHFLCPPMEDYHIEEEDTRWLSYQFEGGRCHMYEKTLALIQLIGSETKDGGRCYMFEKTIALVYWIARRHFVPGGRCHLNEKSIALVYLIAKTYVHTTVSRCHQYEVTLAYVLRIAQEGPAKGGRCHMYEKSIAYVQMLGKAGGGRCHLFEKTIALVQLISIGKRASSI